MFFSSTGYERKWDMWDTHYFTQAIVECSIDCGFFHAVGPLIMFSICIFKTGCIFNVYVFLISLSKKVCNVD